MLEKETNTYEKKLPELLKTNRDKFVLIKEENVIGIFAAEIDALSYGYEKYMDQPFFIRQILPTQQPLNFSNHYFFC